MTEHYVKHPIVLVRLSQIRVDQIRDLLKSAYRFVTSQTTLKKRVSKKRSG